MMQIGNPTFFDEEGFLNRNVLDRETRQLKITSKGKTLFLFAYYTFEQSHPSATHDGTGYGLWVFPPVARLLGRYENLYDRWDYRGVAKSIVSGAKENFVRWICLGGSLNFCEKFVNEKKQGKGKFYAKLVVDNVRHWRYSPNETRKTIEV